MMRTIIAGSRNATNYDHLLKTMALISWRPTLVLSGTARGADRLGERWARENKVACDRYPAQWDKYGKSAGYRRNADMTKNADALIALWDGKSHGTKHMIDLAVQHGLVTWVTRIDQLS